jgi:hypothetical protein
MDIAEDDGGKTRVEGNSNDAELAVSYHERCSPSNAGFGTTGKNNGLAMKPTMGQWGRVLWAQTSRR